MKDSISELKIKDLLKESNHHKDEILKLFIKKGIITKDTYTDLHTKDKDKNKDNDKIKDKDKNK